MERPLGLRNIAIITTVVNFDLYRRTSYLFPPNIVRFVIDGRDGMHSLHSLFYTFKKLRDKGIEWLVMADEDVIFRNQQKIFELINFMTHHEYDVCGVRDGGMIPHRNYNPFSINTFFSILHFSEVEKIFNRKEVKRNHYIDSEEFNDDLDTLRYPYDESSLYEPYYGFYFWLRRKNFKFLFLEAGMPFKEDQIANSVHMPDGDLLLYHTWYARAYGKNKKHTERIDKILKNIPAKNSSYIDPVIFKDPHFAWKENLRKNLRKIKMKINQ